MPAAEVDPAQLENVNLTEALRDAMMASGFKAKWLNPIEMVQQKRQELQQMQEMQQQMAMGGEAARTAVDGGKTLDLLNKAGVDVPRITSQLQEQISGGTNEEEANAA